MSTGFFGPKQIRETVKNILKERKCKDTVESYLSCIEMLESLLSSGEIGTTAMAEIVNAAISNFFNHVDLGIIINGEFSPFDCHLAARHDITTGDFVSGLRFPVLKRRDAKEILQGPATADLPRDCIWDIETQTVLHARCYYLRHIDELMGITLERIRRLDLADAFIQNLHNIGVVTDDDG